MRRELAEPQFPGQQRWLQGLARRVVRRYAWLQDRALVEDLVCVGWIAWLEGASTWRIADRMRDAASSWIYGIEHQTAARRQRHPRRLTHAVSFSDGELGLVTLPTALRQAEDREWIERIWMAAPVRTRVIWLAMFWTGSRVLPRAWYQGQGWSAKMVFTDKRRLRRIAWRAQKGPINIP